MKNISKSIKILLTLIMLVLLGWIIWRGITGSYITLGIHILLLVCGIIAIITIKKIPDFIKIISITIIMILIIWISVVTIDMHRFHDFKKPIFAKVISKYNNLHTYKGLGYTIELKYDYGQVINEDDEKTITIVSGTMYIFNKRSAAFIT